MKNLFWTQADYLAQLQAAWAEWSIAHHGDPDAPVYVASLRADETEQLLARHLGTLESLLFDWEKRTRP